MPQEQPPPVAEQLATRPEPCQHQHHLACIEAVEQRGEPPCPCYEAGQGGKKVEFAK